MEEYDPRAAYEKLRTEPDAIYLDVRSVPEFLQGHPENAWNIPLLHLDEERGGLVANERFLDVVEAHLDKGSTILVGCQSGGRSAKAVELMRRAGYTLVANVRCGFGGARDPLTGQVVEPGWRDLGLPVAEGTAAGRTYEELTAGVG